MPLRPGRTPPQEPAIVPRFHLAGLRAGERIALPADVAHHAGRVLRLAEGDEMVLFDGLGGEYRARLEIPESGGPLRALVLAHDPVEREALRACTLLQAQATGEKLDWVIEKAVELGAAEIVVFGARRSVARLAGDRRERRLQHWRELIAAACCQCGRNRVPGVRVAETLREALAAVPAGTLGYVLAPGPRANLVELRGAGQAPLALAVGPEAGWDAVELVQFQDAGFLPLSLGPRVLRTETAGLAALATVQALAEAA